MNKFRLRSRFLIVRLMIAAGLTAAVILIVRYSFGRQADEQISAELQRCRGQIRALQTQSDAMLAQTAAMVAESGRIRELVKGAPLSTAAAQEFGADLLLITDARGKVWTAGLPEGRKARNEAEDLLKAGGDAPEGTSYGSVAGKLYRVHRSKFSSAEAIGPNGGMLIVGKEMGPELAAQVGASCGCDVAFAFDGRIVASTMNPARELEFAAKLAASDQRSAVPLSLRLAHEPFRVLVFAAATEQPSAEVALLRSLATASAQQSEFMRLMVILAVAAMIIGFFLVLRVSDTFARPLGNLVEAVKALEKGDFSYPVKVESHDELAEVTQAFDQMRSSLRETQQQLIRSERLATIGQMASSISHDLRHPLTAVVANSEFLCEEQPTAEQRQGFYQEIRAAVDQMNDLVESLLEFSRGRESPRTAAVNLDELIERVARSVASRAEFQGIEIRVDCPHPFECSVDPLKVERAVGNLVINACEAVAAGGGRVEVRVSAADSAAEIRIADNGPGVADSIRGAIFQPFVSHGKANGTGLGLAVVQKICRDHGGDATLESSVAGRTVFKMTLPRVG